MKKILSLASIVMVLQVSAQKLITETEFELFGDHIFISVSVDDSDPVDFIFDTGDGLSVLDTDIAKKLNLKPDHQSTKTSAQGSISGSLIAHNKIEINDVKLDDIELYTTELSHLEQTIGRNIDGIIGYDLLKNYVVKIDYEDMKIKLYNQDGYQNTGNGEKFSFKLIHYIPTIQASVTLNNGESYTEDFFLNTGAGTTLDFNTPFAQKHDVIAKTGDHYSYPVAGLEDNETMHYEGRIQNFSIGTFNIDQLPIGISQAEHGIQHNKKVAGIVGNGVLKHFNITFDYSKNEVYLESNKNFEKPYLVNASGINLQFNKERTKLLIHRVFEGSPAEIAGIKVDAQLLAVDGQVVESMKLPEIRAALKQANKSVTVKYLQDGIEKESTLDLDPLI
ncbi:aspartyl protease family protein [Marinoscillum pacificum]|uniref:aspartyl protease family protein n=1 Tax=Marinoscillum pacificum TaxID=392723 RepID=UPI0021584C2E|nr:aspartyl protease family protein [Marinoscillum pacificum]